MKKLTKVTLSDGVAALLVKVKLAVAKLIRTKLLPRAVEKQCEALNEGAQKFINKVGELIDEYNAEEDTTKKYRKLFLIELCVNTMDAIAEAFSTASSKIRAGVDFIPLYKNDEEVKVALADLTDDNGECGPDGCAVV